MSLMAAPRSTSRGAVLLLVAVSVVGLAFAPGVLAQATGGESDNESSFGAQISSFAQASAADANGSVERGMWNASLADDVPPGEAISQRAHDLRDRLDRLQNRSEALMEAKRNGNISGVAYTARASAIHAQLVNLRAAINQTSTAAKRHGVNESALADLKRAAGNATGPEIAAIARNLTDAGHGPPPWAGDGPPADGPGQGGNATDGGPPEDDPGDGGNDPEGGTPEGDGSGNERGGGSDGSPDGG